ncbi:MAG: PorT family protein [Rikenellaceae bacterium]|nr:PorT family protein [Rikenellaceae bacterium]
MKNRYLALFLAAGLGVFSSAAQDARTQALERAAAKGLEYSIRAGFNVGGSAPLPLPQEIREVKGYNPGLNLFIEGNVTKWLDPRWGLVSGLRLETKAMHTRARVKNYGMRISKPGEPPVSGRWTGSVKTDFDNTYITLPILAAYKLHRRVKLQGGFFFSCVSDCQFQGEVYDGYLRNGVPTGNKTVIDNGQRAYYDFSGDLRRFCWGTQLGAEWRAFRQFAVSGYLTWGFNDIFKKDFETISFALYPIYASIGFGYIF